MKTKERLTKYNGIPRNKQLSLSGKKCIATRPGN